jgi:hypothetical protein
MIRPTLALCLAVAFPALLLTSAVQAQTALPITPMATPGVVSGGNIAARKQHIMAKIQQRMGILQGLQSCVAAAPDTTALRTCEEQARAANGAHEKKC